MAAEERFDPLAIVAAFERQGASYVIVGALARVLQGADELTRGVDLTPSLRPKNLERVEAALASLGAEAGSSVTRKTTYLVAGADPGSKLRKAQNYGIAVLDEDGFMQLLHEHGVDVP